MSICRLFELEKKIAFSSKLCEETGKNGIMEITSYWKKKVCSLCIEHLFSDRRCICVIPNMYKDPLT